MNAFAENVVRFGRVLQGLGVRGAAGRMQDVLCALPLVDIGRRDDVYFTLRTLLVNRVEDLPVFDRAFAAFWKARGKAETKTDVRPIGQDMRFGAPVLELWSLAAGEGSGERSEKADLATYGAQEMLRSRDFARMSGEELAEAEALVANLRWTPGLRRSRRWEPGAGARLDPRRLLRQRGEAFVLPTRTRKWKRRPLVLLCDISGSMERYTRMLLRLAHGMAANFSRLEAFVFATRLTRITLPLRRNKVDRALEDIGVAVKDWGGGTRIGDALRRFHVHWARRVLGHGAVVLLISDGWDRGDPEEVARQMARLQRSCHRLIWLNPLLGSPAYEPLTRGMRAALPYVDDFLPVHNVESLSDLARHLETLG